MLFLHAYLLCQSGKEWSYLKCELMLIYLILEAWCSMMKNFHCKLWYANMLPAVEKCVFFWLFNRKTRSRRIWTKYCLLTQKSPRKRSTGPFDQVITQINVCELCQAISWNYILIFKGFDNSDESETSSLCSEKSFDYSRGRPSDVSLKQYFYSTQIIYIWYASPLLSA